MNRGEGRREGGKAYLEGGFGGQIGLVDLQETLVKVGGVFLTSLEKEDKEG